MSVELYDSNRSASAHRVRIALEFKGLDYRALPLSLTRGGGEQLMPEYRAVNPQGLLPSLIDDDFVLTQSLAIIEYLEDCHPLPALLPAAPRARARARQLAQMVVADIQSLTNLRVLAHLRSALQASDLARSRWYRHWLLEGLDALELWLTAEDGGRYCVGDAVTIADLCVVPLLHSARRFALALDDFPRLCKVEAACLELPAFQRAHPE
jgi:maleylpyruvate isomerase